MVAGDWWYETFIGPVLRDRAPEILEGARPSLVLFGAVVTSAAFAVGWLIFGFSSYRAGIFPRVASILMMVGGLCERRDPYRRVADPTGYRGRLDRLVTNSPGWRCAQVQRFKRSRGRVT
jgi:hypothetical protein